MARLGRSQSDDLAAVCALGGASLSRIAEVLDAAPLTIKPEKIHEMIAAQVGQEAASMIRRLLFGLGNVIRLGMATTPELFERLSQSLPETEWAEEQKKQWAECRPALEKLLTQKSVVLAAKAAGLSYDFTTLFVTARILTDIRPVFDDPREEIVGSAITQTLRMDHVSSEGNHESISVILDSKDIIQLQKACEAALRKAEISKKMIEELCHKETIMPGEDIK